MTDRELLEAAAKAAGYEVHWQDEKAADFDAEYLGMRAVNREHINEYWNPLTDDGDALRLFACMPFCELYVSEIGATVFLPRRGQGEGPNLKCDESAHETNGDLQAATRRAIVRAAAEIGRSMK
jgi:hypothetical protein